MVGRLAILVKCFKVVFDKQWTVLIVRVQEFKDRFVLLA
jgi:hypothetical protein